MRGHWKNQCVNWHNKIPYQTMVLLPWITSSSLVSSTEDRKSISVKLHSRLLKSGRALRHILSLINVGYAFQGMSKLPISHVFQFRSAYCKHGYISRACSEQAKLATCGAARRVWPTAEERPADNKENIPMTGPLWPQIYFYWGM